MERPPWDVGKAGSEKYWAWRQELQRTCTHEGYGTVEAHGLLHCKRCGYVLGKAKFEGGRMQAYYQSVEAGKTGEYWQALQQQQVVTDKERAAAYRQHMKTVAPDLWKERRKAAILRRKTLRPEVFRAAVRRAAFRSSVKRIKARSGELQPMCHSYRKKCQRIWRDCRKKAMQAAGGCPPKNYFGMHGYDMKDMKRGTLDPAEPKDTKDPLLWEKLRKRARP